MIGKKDFTVSDLSKFIAREALDERKRVQRIVEGDPEGAITVGDVLGPLKPVSKEGGNYLLRGDKIYFSRFRNGDRVDLAEINSRTKKFKKLKSTSIRLIRFPEPGAIEILVLEDALLLNEKSEIFLLPQSFSGLKWSLRQRLQDIAAAGGVANHCAIDHRSLKNSFKETTGELNSTQADALGFLLENDLRGLVQGPPGTGKTKLLVELVQLAVKNNLRVGLASFTHAAVDNALAKIIHAGVNSDLVVRVSGEKQKIKTGPYKGFNVNQIWSASLRSAGTPSDYDDGGKYLVYAATLHTWCYSNHTPEIDLLIIDEAGQVPLYFYPFLEVLCSRVIMFGDHRQLPPVIQLANHNLPAEDIFSYEIQCGNYPMLEIQYRMNEGIQEWPSQRFYEGRLRPDMSNRHRDIIRGVDALSGRIGSKFVNMVIHSGSSYNNANKVEASRVADLVWALKTEGSLPLEEIGIVTPHRAQAGAICARLQEKIGLLDMQRVLVDTVERFQGQEREAMILSMGVEKDHSRKGDRGFLGDGRRLNVAVTRAKSRFYCMAPGKLIENTKKQKNAGHLNSFFEWCAASDKRDASKETA